MKTIYTIGKVIGAFLISLLIHHTIDAQNTIPRDSLLAGAKDIISQTTYCGLVTGDATGLPQVRTMNPFPVKDDFVIWFATSRSSEKVSEIRNNSAVNVYFADHSKAIGYVSISGKAEVIDDKELLVKMKREYWEGIPNWKDIFVLIKVTPVAMEVINYKYRINNNPQTFKAPEVKF
jgi:general stress protein 26